MRLLLASSTKYRQDWPEIKQKLAAKGFDPVLPDEADKGSRVRGDTISNYLDLIGQSDGLFVWAPDGEVGKSVSSEIGYAFAKNKKIFSSRKLNDDGLRYYINKVIGL